jgi:hypothetical protein
MWGNETLAMEVSRSSMNVASVTVTAMIQGLTAGRRAAGIDPGINASATALIAL